MVLFLLIESLVHLVLVDLTTLTGVMKLEVLFILILEVVLLSHVAEDETLCLI
jgi:hypothetical protein